MTTTRALVVVLLATGCGGIGGGVPREQYTTESFKAICAHYANCGLAKSADGCNQYFQSIIGSYISSSTSVYDKAIELGKIKYDSAAAGRCLSSYANAACSLAALTSPNSDCRSIYVGQVPVGQACGYGECVPSAYCTAETDGKCPGTCKDRVQAGGSATSQAACAVGLVLISGSCSQPPGEGSSCGTGTTGTTSVCAAGLTCATDTKTCVKPRLQGDACSTTMACDIFYSCVNGKCAAPADVGVACGSTSGGLPCKLELFCKGTGTAAVCSERFAEGAVCSGSECAYNLRCGKATAAAVDKTCNKPLALNQTCTSTSECDSTLFCSGTSKTCVAQLATGAACTTGDVCSGGVCTSNKCVSYLTSTCF